MHPMVSGLTLLLAALNPAAEATNPQVVVEDGALSATMANGTLRVDLRTGALDLTPSRGAAWQTDTAMGWPQAKDPLARYERLVLDALADGAYGEALAMCAGDAYPVSALAGLLPGACIQPGSKLCTSSTAALSYAVDALRECVARVPSR